MTTPMQCEPDVEDNTTFPSIFPDVGGMSFKYVFENRKEWVRFTVDKMNNCTGFFFIWRNYCLQKK